MSFLLKSLSSERYTFPLTNYFDGSYLKMLWFSTHLISRLTQHNCSFRKTIFFSLPSDAPTPPSGLESCSKLNVWSFPPLEHLSLPFNAELIPTSIQLQVTLSPEAVQVSLHFSHEKLSQVLPYLCSRNMPGISLL